MQVNLSIPTSRVVNFTQNKAVTSKQGISQISRQDRFGLSEEEIKIQSDRFINLLKTARDGADLPEISPKILRKILGIVRSNNLSRESEYAQYYAQLGKNIQNLYLRKFLLEQCPEKNSFVLTVNDTALRSNYSSLIIPTLNFHKIIGSIPKNGEERRECANRYYATIAWISRGVENGKAMEEFFRPYFEKALKIENKERFINILRATYKGQRRYDRTFSYKTEQLPSGIYRTTGFVDDLEVEKAYAPTGDESEMRLFKKLMAQLRVYPLNPNNTELKKKLFDIDKIKDAVNKMLSDIGFISKKMKFKKSSELAPDYILRALSPQLSAYNSINHQKLEYYGDAVCNLLVENFLLGKSPSLQDKRKLYKEMKSNKVFAEFFDKLKLEKYVMNKGEKIDDKLKADVFEALIGALHLSYPEKYVHIFLKPLLEQKYQELAEKFKINQTIVK